MRKETPPLSPEMAELASAGYRVLQVPDGISGKKRLNLIEEQLRKPNPFRHLEASPHAPAKDKNVQLLDSPLAEEIPLKKNLESK